MARRSAYTKVERKNFANPEHVEGMGDHAFKGFQCLSKDCTNFIFIRKDEIGDDFSIDCPDCGFSHCAAETTTLYDYDLKDTRDGSIVEAGQFEILHDDYIFEAQDYKYCIVCGAMKPLEYFDRHSARRTGRQGECSLCKKVYNSIKNQTRLTEQHREASQKRRLYTQFEDPQKLDIKAIYDRFDGKCFKCGKDLSADLDADAVGKLGNLDHTLPVYFLWPLTTDNATLLCGKHNGQKAEKWPSKYYSDGELKKLSAKTGVEYKLMAGDPAYNPEALDRLNDPEFIDKLFEKFARYPDELLRLRNRILVQTDFDFLDVSAKISPDWKKQADEML